VVLSLRLSISLELVLLALSRSFLDLAKEILLAGEE
jgi:hypothetical protein